jgi:ribosome-associated toxin RatA of RatAB toxin-antitoxin module
MIELEYQLGYPYPPAVIFAVLANVADYPAWQSDVLAARVQGGGPARPGAEVSVVRKVLGRSEYFRMYVDEYEQDRELTLKTGTDASPLLTHAFRLKPAVTRDCCWLSLRVNLAGAPSLAEPVAEASLLYRVIEAFDGLRSYLASTHVSHLRLPESLSEEQPPRKAS